MLDPDLIDQLAAQPEKNAPAVNLALAEEGHGTVLLALAQSPATAADALETIARRIDDEGDALDDTDEDDDLEDGDARAISDELDRLLIAHPASSDDVRDRVRQRHDDDPYFVLAAASHARATIESIRRAALWPCQSVVFDRRWLMLVPPEALPPLVAEEWSQDPDPCLREVVASLSRDQALLEMLSHDSERQVRRAIASNPHAANQRQRLSHDEIAPEVRARASAPPPSLRSAGSNSVDSVRFVAALRAMQAGGVLAPDVATALSASEADLDPEGAMLAARVLPHQPLVALITEAAAHDSPTHASIGLAAGLALRDPHEEFRELVSDAAKAISGASKLYGNLTGKARLAAWLGDGIANSAHVDRATLVQRLCDGVLAGESEVLARGAAQSASLFVELCRRAAAAEAAPPALLELAWRSTDIDDDTVVAMAQRIAKHKRRGKDLPDDELDLEPGLRDLSVLERVVLAVSRRVMLTPRSALPVIALDSRRVRYVLTAMPAWRGRLSGTLLSRVLRQRAGALSAARSETRSRVAEVRDWTQRIMSDTEVAVAMAVGHYTAQALIDRISSGRHKLLDGSSVASGAEARAVIEGADSIKPLIRYATQRRGKDGAALALWLLLEAYDRHRPAAMIASAVDAFAQAQPVVSDTLSDALATLERRQPGRLESVFASTPRGKATMASAIARAYRAVGGLRDEH
jgi:hypothetical protein